jgi:DNA-binding transcriptional LysR family regulator
MELRHIRYFVAVAEELNFRRAAERLHMAQPPLSQQIRTLEDELDTRLFNRTRRVVELTDAGRAFLEEARITLAQAERAARVAREAGQGIRGQLRIGFVTSASYSILPDAVRRYRTAHTGIDVELREMIPADQLNALRARQIDVGLLRPPLDEADIVVEPLLAEPFVAALPAGHRLARRKSLELTMLKDEAFVLFPRRHGPGLHDLIMQACHAAGFTPQIAYEPNEMQAILAYVAAGLGVSVVPASLSDFHRKLVRYRRLDADVPFAELTMAVLDGRSSPIVDHFKTVALSAAQAFTDHIKGTV